MARPFFRVFQLVEHATDESLPAADWNRNVAVLDFVNYYQDGEVTQYCLKAIKRRFRTGKTRVQMLSLTLLESCVQNCGPLFHERLAGAELWRDLQDAATNTKKYSLDVQGKVRQLIQEWAAELRPNTFSEVHSRLKKKKVHFPPPPANRPPIRAPGPPRGALPPGNVTYSAPPAGYGGGAFAPPGYGGGPYAPPPTYGSPGQVDPRMVSTLPPLPPRPATREAAQAEIARAKQTTDFLDELLQEIEEENPAGITQDHVHELVQQCQVLKFVMSDVAGDDVGEELVAGAVSAHEALGRVMDRYNAILASPTKRAAAAAQRQQQANGGGGAEGRPLGAGGSDSGVGVSSAAPATTTTTSLIDELLSMDSPVAGPPAADPFAPAAPSPSPFGDVDGFGGSAFGGSGGFGGAAAAPPQPATGNPFGNPFAEGGGPAAPSGALPGAGLPLPPGGAGAAPGLLSMGGANAGPGAGAGAPSQSGYPPVASPYPPRMGSAPMGQGGALIGGGDPFDTLAAARTASPPGAAPAMPQKDAFDDIVRARAGEGNGMGTAPAAPSLPPPAGGAYSLMPSPAAAAPAVYPGATAAPSMYPPAPLPGYAAAYPAPPPSLGGRAAAGAVPTLGGGPSANPFESPRQPAGYAAAGPGTVSTLQADAATAKVAQGMDDPFDSLVSMRSSLPR